MNFKRIFISTMLGLAALKCATLIYAAIENPIVDIKTEQELDKFLKENPLVVVEFHDLDCPVCQAFQRKGIFKQTAMALPHIKFAKVSKQEGLALHKNRNSIFKTFQPLSFSKTGKSSSLAVTAKRLIDS